MQKAVETNARRKFSFITALQELRYCKLMKSTLKPPKKIQICGFKVSKISTEHKEWKYKSNP